MHVQLPAVRRRQLDQWAQLLGAVEHEPAMTALVAVVPEQSRAAAAERAIDPSLHGTHVQAIGKLRRLRGLCHHSTRFGLVGQHGVDAQGQFARRAELLIGRVLTHVDAGIVHAGDSQGGQLHHG
jgi:hypothetical protein